MSRQFFCFHNNVNHIGYELFQIDKDLYKEFKIIKPIGRLQ